MQVMKKFFVFLLIAGSLMAVPKQSHAGIIGDILKDIFGNKDKDKDKKPSPGTGNTVPINGGLVVLFAAGLGLGTKMILDRRKQLKEAIA